MVDNISAFQGFLELFVHTRARFGHGATGLIEGAKGESRLIRSDVAPIELRLYRPEDNLLKEKPLISDPQQGHSFVR
jgi:hypothetical protein